jgi:hypothetical protein
MTVSVKLAGREKAVAVAWPWGAPEANADGYSSTNAKVARLVSTATGLFANKGLLAAQHARSSAGVFSRNNLHTQELNRPFQVDGCGCSLTHDSCGGDKQEKWRKEWHKEWQ